MKVAHFLCYQIQRVFLQIQHNSSAILEKKLKEVVSEGSCIISKKETKESQFLH
jgi:hypothetical protein